MARLVTACPASHRNDEHNILGSSAIAAFGWEGSVLADVYFEQSGLVCAKRLSGMPQPSCCFSINFLNRMLDGPTHLRCLRICLLRPLPLPVRGKPSWWGGFSLLTVCRVCTQEAGHMFLYARALSVNTAHICGKISTSCV